MTELLARLRPRDQAQRLFIGFVLLLVGGGAFALLQDKPFGLVPALAVLGLAVLAVDWRWVYYLLLCTLAFSIEIQVPGGLSMDVPTEPLMLVLLACLGGAVLTGRSGLTARQLAHPLVAVLGLMLLWASVSTLFSVDTTKSIKYLLAKTWYIGPFLLVTLMLVRRPSDVWRIAGCHAAGAAATVLYAGGRHATRGFGFAEINWSLSPFYFNHVIYATVLALLLPYAYYAARSTRGGWRLVWQLLIGIFLFGLVTSYTRASMLSIPVAAIFYLVMRWHLTRWLIVGTVLGLAVGVGYFVQQNNYMLYAPDFEKTVFNGNNFEKHLEATYKLQDVSGMERVYRWVAAARMVSDKPLTGSGPSTFYPEYKRYTVKSFRTYVSDNPEKSTTHNYFLLQLAEQGVPGFLLFALLICMLLLMAENIYHRSRPWPEIRSVVLATTLSLVVIIFHLTLNELIEVDKIGSFFFIGLAVLIRCQHWIEDAKPE